MERRNPDSYQDTIEFQRLVTKHQISNYKPETILAYLRSRDEFPISS